MKQRNKLSIADLTKLAGMGAVAASGQVVTPFVEVVDEITPDYPDVPQIDQPDDTPTAKPDDDVPEPIVVADEPLADETDEPVAEPVVAGAKVKPRSIGAQVDRSEAVEPIVAGKIIEVSTGDQTVTTDREGLDKALDAALTVIYDLGAPIVVQAIVDAIVIRVKKRHDDHRLLEVLLALPTEEEQKTEKAYRGRLGQAILDYAANVRVDERDDELVLTVELPADATARAKLLAAATR